MTTPQQKHTPAALRGQAAPPGDFGRKLWVAGLLGNLHDSGFAVDTCVAGQERDALFAAYLTRQQVLQCLKVMINSAEDMPYAVKTEMPAIAWDALIDLRHRLAGRNAEERDVLWAAMTVLVPATLRALNRYRKQHPGLFAFV